MNQNYYQPPVNPQLNYQFYKKAQQKKEKHEILTIGFGLGAAILAYLIIQTIALELLNTTGLKAVFDQSSMFQYLFNVLAVHICAMLIPFSILAIIMRKRFVTPVIPTKKVGVAPFWSWVGLGMLCCYVANIFVSFLIVLVKQFGYELTKGEYLGPQNVLDCLAIIVATAIVPCIIEEASLRGIGLGLLVKHGKPFAVFAISIVFGLLHGNVIQFIFAFLIGLILAYITIQTDSIIPAMVIHGFNNGISAMQQILDFGAGKRVSTIAIEAIYILFAISGIAGGIYLIATKRLLPKKNNQPKNPFALGFGTKLICFLPGMAIPLLILILLSVRTIVKI